MPERPALPRPMLATAGPLPRSDEQHLWAYEIKWDGMRAVAEARPDGWRLVGRSGRDVTASFPDLAGPNGLADLSGLLGGRTVVVDGEIVALDDRGGPSFSRLQQRMNVARPSTALVAAVPASYLVFDLLAIDGVEAVALPYRDRRRLLDELDLGRLGPGPVAVPAVLAGTADDAWSTAVDLELEGLVAKRLDSPYLPGRRTTAWRKVKRLHEREVVVVGWTDGEGRRGGGLGALVVAVPASPGADATDPTEETEPLDPGDPGTAAPPGDRGPAGPASTSARPALVLAGRVGTGFSDRDLDELLATLRPLERPDPPVLNPPPARTMRDVHWVEPDLVGEVTFTEWTPDGSLRHPVWRGLRPDRSPLDLPPGSA